MSEQRYLSLRQVGTELGLAPEQLGELIRSGRLPAFRVVGKWRVDRLMLERLIDDLLDECAPILGTLSVTDAVGAHREAEAEHPPPVPQQRSTPLTEHQERIVRLVCEGMSNAEIAHRLSIEVSTVKSHISRVLQRFNLRDREQLIVHVWRSGLMDSRT